MKYSELLRLLKREGGMEVRQTRRILDGVQQIGKELCEASFIMP